MAKPQIIFLISLLLLALAFYSVTADLDEEAPFKELPEKKIVIEGMVYCQSCNELGTDSLSGAESIPYAWVSVTCKNHEERVFYYKEYTTNENGYFYAELEGFSTVRSLFDHPLNSCKVKLASSPDGRCNVPTNINNGITGASLCREHKKSTKKDCDYEFYAAGPLAFRRAQCTSDNVHY